MTHEQKRRLGNLGGYLHDDAAAVIRELDAQLADACAQRDLLLAACAALLSYAPADSDVARAARVAMRVRS